MAQKLKGVGGVLGSLISEPEPVTSEPPLQSTTSPAIAGTLQNDLPEQATISSTTDKARPKTQARVAARRGRPPGQKPGEAADKEKVTLRLNKDLMDDYREWSWEERCQLGELVEKAMTHYRKSRNRSKSQ